MGKKKVAIRKLAEKYKHAWVFCIFYLHAVVFAFGKSIYQTTNYHVIQTQFDMWIPFG